jgi:hypothetical protein
METTRLDRCVDAPAINLRRERWRSQRTPQLSERASAEWIAQVIDTARPAAIGLLGRHECGVLAAHLGIRQFYKYTWAAPSYSEAQLPKVGVFPASDETYWRFAELLLERMAFFDAWATTHQIAESKILASCGAGRCRLAPRALEPYLSDTPWSSRLAGKRVLVIHAFEPSIRAQYARRGAVWPERPGVLPEFSLEVARAPWGFVRSGFNDWFAMLRWFEERVEAIHRRAGFDVALIDCGPAGLALAAFVKKLGAVGIHLGPALPTLFGIYTETDENAAGRRPFQNAAWVRPQPSEAPVLPTGSTPQFFQPRR